MVSEGYHVLNRNILDIVFGDILLILVLLLLDVTNLKEFGYW